MKAILYTILATGIIGTANAQNNKKETIEGNGKIINRTVSVKSFDALDAEGVFEIKLIQGNNESVFLEGDENLLEYITVHNEGTKLIIDMDKLKDKNVNYKTKNKLKVSVTFRNVKAMEFKTVGDVASSGELKFDNLLINHQGVGTLNITLTANTISLKNKGVSDIILTGKATQATIKNSGVGSIKAGNLAVQSMNIQNSGVGSAEVNVEKDVKVRSSGLGSVKNKGAAPIPRKMKTAVI
ncbi:MAG: head GIN domain-containing protein [Ferruginibacter sp.]